LIIVKGNEVFDNFYYIPPKDFFSPNSQKAKLDTWFARLSYYNRAEIRLDKYFKNLERVIEERTEEINKALHYSKEAMDEIDDILKSDADE
jgi:hypothetical protein